MNSFSLLQTYRLGYEPTLPSILEDLNNITSIQSPLDHPLDQPLQELFPHAANLPFLSFKKGRAPSNKPLKVGVVFSGGQAAGGHNVITGLLDALKKSNIDSRLIGFLNGPMGIIKNQSIELTVEKVALYRNQGGFDLIGSSRTKIETPEQYDSVEKTLRAHMLDGLVIVGGDDSNTNAAFLAEFCHQKAISTNIVGVPKTIDGDLKNEYIEISFGFDTATKVYSEMIGNLLIDALSAKKYYFFIKLMGRSASHITLECALQTKVNLALIGEEIAERKGSLSSVVDQISDLICARAKKEKHYGAILIPEGLLEFIPEFKLTMRELGRLLADDRSFVKLLEDSPNEALKNVETKLTPVAASFFSILPRGIQKQLLIDRDSHGNIQVSKIDTERLLITLVEENLKERKKKGEYSGPFNPQPLFFGYEGRSALPTNFDCQYSYALGHLAALLIQEGASGYMCCLKHLTKPVESWEPFGVPLVHMLHFEMRKNKNQAVLKKALVDLEAAPFKSFKRQRDFWQLDDVYSCPGPIQFEGPVELTDKPPLTLI